MGPVGGEANGRRIIERGLGDFGTNSQLVLHRRPSGEQRQLVGLLASELADCRIESTEVLAHLVVAAVFKTVGPYVNHAAGGFDSHALPPFFLGTLRCFPMVLANRPLR